MKSEKPDSLRLDLGWGLFPLVDPEKGRVLLTQITMLRETLRNCGITMPSVRIIDNISELAPTGYRVTVYGVEMGWGNLPARLSLPDQASAITGQIEEILKTPGDIFSRTLPDGTVVPGHTDYAKLKPKDAADEFFRQGAYITKMAAELARRDREKALELQSRGSNVDEGGV